MTAIDRHNFLNLFEFVQREILQLFYIVLKKLKFIKIKFSNTEFLSYPMKKMLLVQTAFQEKQFHNYLNFAPTQS